MLPLPVAYLLEALEDSQDLLPCAPSHCALLPSSLLLSHITVAGKLPHCPGRLPCHFVCCLLSPIDTQTSFWDSPSP